MAGTLKYGIFLLALLFLISGINAQFCASNEECLTNQECLAGICVPSEENDVCFQNEDCASGLVCKEGICQKQSKGLGALAKNIAEAQPIYAVGSAIIKKIKSCESPADCTPEKVGGKLGYTCLDKSCVEGYDGYPCFGADNCLGGICSASGFCSSIGGEGYACSADSGCQTGFYCSENSCKDSAVNVKVFFAESQYLKQRRYAAFLEGFHPLLKDNFSKDKKNPIVLTVSENVPNSYYSNYLVYPKVSYPISGLALDLSFGSQNKPDVSFKGLNPAGFTVKLTGEQEPYFLELIFNSDKKDAITQGKVVKKISGSIIFTYSKLWPAKEIEIPVIIFNNPCKIEAAESETAQTYLDLIECYDARIAAAKVDYAAEYKKAKQAFDGNLWKFVEEKPVYFVNFATLKETLERYNKFDYWGIKKALFESDSIVVRDEQELLGKKSVQAELASQFMLLEEIPDKYGNFVNNAFSDKLAIYSVLENEIPKLPEETKKELSSVIVQDKKVTQAALNKWAAEKKMMKDPFDKANRDEYIAKIIELEKTIIKDTSYKVSYSNTQLTDLETKLQEAAKKYRAALLSDAQVSTAENELKQVLNEILDGHYGSATEIITKFEAEIKRLEEESAALKNSLTNSIGLDSLQSHAINPLTWVGKPFELLGALIFGGSAFASEEEIAKAKSKVEYRIESLEKQRYNLINHIIPELGKGKSLLGISADITLKLKNFASDSDSQKFKEFDSVLETFENNEVVRTEYRKQHLLLNKSFLLDMADASTYFSTLHALELERDTLLGTEILLTAQKEEILEGKELREENLVNLIRRVVKVSEDEVQQTISLANKLGEERKGIEKILMQLNLGTPLAEIVDANKTLNKTDFDLVEGYFLRVNNEIYILLQDYDEETNEATIRAFQNGIGKTQIKAKVGETVSYPEIPGLSIALESHSKEGVTDIIKARIVHNSSWKEKPLTAWNFTNRIVFDVPKAGAYVAIDLSDEKYGVESPHIYVLFSNGGISYNQAVKEIEEEGKSLLDLYDEILKFSEEHPESGIKAELQYISKRKQKTFDETIKQAPTAADPSGKAQAALEDIPIEIDNFEIASKNFPGLVLNADMISKQENKAKVTIYYKNVEMPKSETDDSKNNLISLALNNATLNVQAEQYKAALDKKELPKEKLAEMAYLIAKKREIDGLWQKALANYSHIKDAYSGTKHGKVAQADIYVLTSKQKSEQYLAVLEGFTNTEMAAMTLITMGVGFFVKLGAKASVYATRAQRLAAAGKSLPLVEASDAAKDVSKLGKLKSILNSPFDDLAARITAKPIMAYRTWNVNKLILKAKSAQSSFLHFILDIAPNEIPAIAQLPNYEATIAGRTMKIWDLEKSLLFDTGRGYLAVPKDPKTLSELVAKSKLLRKAFSYLEKNGIAASQDVEIMKELEAIMDQAAQLSKLKVSEIPEIKNFAEAVESIEESLEPVTAVTQAGLAPETVENLAAVSGNPLAFSNAANNAGLPQGLIARAERFSQTAQKEALSAVRRTFDSSVVAGFEADVPGFKGIVELGTRDPNAGGYFSKGIGGSGETLRVYTGSHVWTQGGEAQFIESLTGTVGHELTHARFASLPAEAQAEILEAYGNHPELVEQIYANLMEKGIYETNLHYPFAGLKTSNITPEVESLLVESGYKVPAVRIMPNGRAASLNTIVDEGSAYFNSRLFGKNLSNALYDLPDDIVQVLKKHGLFYPKKEAETIVEKAIDILEVSPAPYAKDLRAALGMEKTTTVATVVKVGSKAEGAISPIKVSEISLEGKLASNYPATVAQEQIPSALQGSLKGNINVIDITARGPEVRFFAGVKGGNKGLVTVDEKYFMSVKGSLWREPVDIVIGDLPQAASTTTSKSLAVLDAVERDMKLASSFNKTEKLPEMKAFVGNTAIETEAGVSVQKYRLDLAIKDSVLKANSEWTGLETLDAQLISVSDSKTFHTLFKKYAAGKPSTAEYVVFTDNETVLRVNKAAWEEAQRWVRGDTPSLITKGQNAGKVSWDISFLRRSEGKFLGKKIGNEIIIDEFAPEAIADDLAKASGYDTAVPVEYTSKTRALPSPAKVESAAASKPSVLFGGSNTQQFLVWSKTDKGVHQFGLLGQQQPFSSVSFAKGLSEDVIVLTDFDPEAVGYFIVREVPASQMGNNAVRVSLIEEGNSPTILIETTDIKRPIIIQRMQ